TVQVDNGRSAQCGVDKVAKIGHSASCGRSDLPIKTCSEKWKVGFVSAQKPFLVITNGNFACENIVPLTVRYPFGRVISCSEIWRPHHVAVKWLFGKRTSGVFAAINGRKQERKGVNMCLKPVSFWMGITKSFLAKGIITSTNVAGVS
ncbi:MAG: hypothetical protein JG771_686, partial [Methermicoccus sp.]|nr:hypothetical protein [Methermicoccus sp.]